MRRRVLVRPAVVSPIVLGGGTRFFTGLNQSIGLALVETRTFGGGVVYLRYERG